IRDPLVTGVQTCALPICPVFASHALICGQPDQRVAEAEPVRAHALDQALALERIEMTFDEGLGVIWQKSTHCVMPKVHTDDGCRSEERRVGKEGRAWRSM